MSLRDEMVSKALAGYRRGFTPGEMVDDLMPLVERAVKEAARQSLYQAMSNTPWGDEPKAADDWVAPIVARVTGKGGL